MSLRARLLGWTAIVAALLVLCAVDVRPGFRLETDILALLPGNEADPAEARALDRFSDRIGRNAAWLIGAPDFAQARKAASAFAAVLSASPAFARVRFEIDADWPAESAAAYLPYRDGLLSDRMRAQLLAHEDEALLAQAQQALYTPAAFLRRSGPGSDPLNLFGDFLASADPPAGHARLHEGVLQIEADEPDLAAGQQYVVVATTLAGNPFSTEVQALVIPAIEAAVAAAEAEGATVSTSGLTQHAVIAARIARSEVGLFAGIQFVGIALIMFWVFRSLRMLLLSAATLAVAVIAALAASHYVFTTLHVMTLVFCSNLAGIAIDYAIYFGADQFRAPGRWAPREALRRIGPAITMSCLAALLSYALLAVAPFPGLRQMALFCCVGLAAAYGTVMGWFPALLKPAPAAAAARLSAHFERLGHWRERLSRRPLRVVSLLLAALTVGGLLRLQHADDVLMLQPDMPDLKQQEKRVRALLGTIPEGRFFLVRGDSAEQVLQREEALRLRLDALVAKGLARSYLAVSRALPSQARQASDHRLLAERVYAADGLAPRFMQQLGFDPALIAQRLKAFESGSAPLLPEAWLAAPGSELFRPLWLGRIDAPNDPHPAARPHAEEWASIVTLSGLKDPTALLPVADGLPGVRLVNRLAEVSDVLKRYRERALLLVALAAVASGLMLAVAYGLRRGFLLMAAPVASCLVTLALFGWLGIAVTFFHVVALHLVTGLSMEYAILLMLPQWKGPATLLSASLAALLALLAFGLLAFSATPFIHSLGLTVAVGVLFGFLFAFVAGTLPARANDKTS